ncbi:MAG: hypothetical protein RR314_04450 [Oscillospiraceae bacterium]
MLTSKFSQHVSRVCIVKIFSYDDRNPRGILQNLHLEQDVSFANLTQLLLAMDSLFDEIGNPQRSMTPRGFVRENAENRDTCDSPGGEKPIATFRIDVVFRQNASWQGNLTWMDKKEEAQFRSALELIMLMDSSFRAGEGATPA